MRTLDILCVVVFFFQAEDGIRDDLVTGVQTCALPILARGNAQFVARPGPNGANGHGAHHELRVSSGHGLSNIALRVAEMGGTYEFTPAQGGPGARLMVVIALGPIPADKSAPAGRRS